MEELKWEQITGDGYTWRLLVFGGWLVRYDNDALTNVGPYHAQVGYQWRSCMVFVPDPQHKWDLEWR